MCMRGWFSVRLNLCRMAVSLIRALILYYNGAEAVNRFEFKTQIQVILTKLILGVSPPAQLTMSCSFIGV